MFNKQKIKGFGLTEVIVGLSVIFISLISIITSYNFFLKIANNNTKIVKAEFLLEEGVEVLRFIRDKGWNEFSNISLAENKFLIFQNGTWEISDENNYTDNLYERSFVIDNVYRDSNNDIVETGTLDTETKKVTISVSWSNLGSTTTNSTSVYLTNLFDN